MMDKKTTAIITKTKKKDEMRIASKLKFDHG
jgi:hypothetical protein